MVEVVRSFLDAFRDDDREELGPSVQPTVRTTNAASMVNSFDKQFVDMWIENVIEPNRLEGTWDVDARFEEMARGGLAAEVIREPIGTALPQLLARL